MSTSTLFLPSSKDIKVEYPELATIAEFIMLRDAQLKFVWYYANSTSDILALYPLDDNKRCLAAFEKSGLKKHMNPQEKHDFLSLNFTPDIKAAIERMKSFDVSTREKGKIAIEKMFNNLTQMASLTADNLKIMDLSEKKEYASLVKTSLEVMPDLIQKMEEGFGIRKRKTATDGSTFKNPTLMDKAIKED